MVQETNASTPGSSPSYATARRSLTPFLPLDVIYLALLYLDKGALAKMAVVSRCFKDRALSLLWMDLDSAAPLLNLLRLPLRTYFRGLNLRIEDANEVMNRWMFYAKKVHRLVLDEVTIKKEERDFLLRQYHCAPLLPNLRILLISDDSGSDFFGLGRWDQETYMSEHMVILFLSPSLKKLAIGVNATWSLDWGRIESRCPDVEDLCIGFPTSSYSFIRQDYGKFIDYMPQNHLRHEEPWGYRVTKCRGTQPSQTPALSDAICQWKSLTKLGITGRYESLPRLLHSMAKLPFLASLTIFDPAVDDDWSQVRVDSLGDDFANLHELSLHPGRVTAARCVFEWPGLLCRVVRLRWELCWADEIIHEDFLEAIRAVGENARSLHDLELQVEFPEGQRGPLGWKEVVKEALLSVSCEAIVHVIESSPEKSY